MLKKLSVAFLLLFLPSWSQGQDLYEQISRLHDLEDYAGILKHENDLIGLVKGKSDTLAANVYFYLADSHLKSGSLKKSVEYFNQARTFREAILPDDPEEYSFILFNLTDVYFRTNALEKGKAIGQQLIDFDRKTFGASSEQYVNSLLNYTDILIKAGSAALAEQLLEQALKELPVFSDESARILSRLADTCRYLGKYKKAERLFMEALELLQVTEGEASEMYNITLSNYASLLMEQARYDKAEAFLTDVLAASVNKDWFTEETQYASLNNLALVYQSLGQYSSSEKTFSHLMKLDSVSIGPDHPDFAITFSNLGLLYADEGKLNEAENALKNSLTILEKNEASQSVSFATSLNNLAKVYVKMNRYAEGISLFEQALKIMERQFGKQSPQYATVLFNLGTAYLATNSPKTLVTLKRAKTIREKTLGKEHPLYAECEERIAQYYWKKKSWKEAEVFFQGTFQNYFAQIENYFPVLTEEEKTNFFYNKVKPSLESYAFFVANDPSPSVSLGNLYDYHINTKGLILFATEKVRQSVLNSNDKDLIGLYEQWENTKDVLTYYYSIHESQKKIDSLVQQSRDLEKQLTRKSEDFSRNIIRSKISWKSIQEKLQPGEAVLECIRYRVYHPDSGTFTQQLHYAFLLLTTETKDAPRVITFERGKDMEGRYLNYYRNGIRLMLDDLYTFNNYWAPLHDELQRNRITKVYFSPDGVYNIINLGTIKNPFTNRYLMEEYDFRLMTSSRSLVESGKPGGGLKTGYLFGYPTYNVTAGADQPFRTVSASRSFRGEMLRFIRDGRGIAPLPGTQKEVKNIAKELEEAFASVNVRVETEALESSIKSVRSPALLHIATHGYFLDDEENEGDYHVPNPLLMSGLILAGAENFIRTGHNPMHENDDGILTAFEAMNLNLNGTELVVLSACETGLGKIYPGEGVYGLQRAFQVAGAEAIIMSLWNVDDEATQLLMKDFYHQYINSGNIYDSFKLAQQNLQERYPEPFYWGAFILVGKGN